LVEVIICSKCGFILHKGEEVLAPREVAKKFNYRCPSCYRKINVDSIKISIMSSNK